MLPDDSFSNTFVSTKCTNVSMCIILTCYTCVTVHFTASVFNIFLYKITDISVCTASAYVYSSSKYVCKSADAALIIIFAPFYDSQN